MKNQEKQQAMDEFTNFMMSPEGEQSMRDALDQWFTMGDIVEALDEEYPNLKDKEFINKCLERYDMVYPMDDYDRNLWIKTLKDMFKKQS